MSKKKKGHRCPIWRITNPGTDESVHWVDHSLNPRFAIYNSETPEDETEDIVLDKETCLIWERSPVAESKEWDPAIVYSYTKALAGRKGWRLPTIEELLSLADPAQSNPTLPIGHPFVNIKLDNFYWSSTLGMSSLPDYAWGYNFGNADTSNCLKSTNYYVWLVRGGYGHDYHF